MFKNVFFFRCEGALPHPALLEAQMAVGVFVACAPSQEASAGWVAPRGENGALVESIGGQWILTLQVEERRVPPQTLKRETNLLIDQIEKDTGRRPRGKRVRELKEQALHALLPRAFSKLSRTFVWIDPAEGLVAVGTSSTARCDQVLTRLVEAMPGVKVKPAATRTPPPAAMGAWLAEKEAPAGFTIDRDCELKQPDSEKAAVRYARHTLDIDEVGEHLKQGKVPTQLAMTFDSRVSFTLTDWAAPLLLKRVKLLDVALEGAAADADAFDADVAITTGELKRLYGELVGALGGEVR